MDIKGSNSVNNQEAPIPTTGRVAIGHPVDVASGTLFHDFTDYTLPGRFPLAFKRHYSTSLLNVISPGMLGRGWSTPFEVKLSQDENGYRYLDEKGEKEIVFPIGDNEGSGNRRILNAGAYADLTSTEQEYCVTKWNPDTGEVIRDYFPKNSRSNLIPITRRENQESAVIEFIYEEPTGLLKYVLQKQEQRGFQFNYDQAGRLKQILRKSRQSSKLDKQTENEPWLQFQYNSKDMLQSCIDPLGNRSQYSYDNAGQMVKEITMAGKEWRFVYDEQGRCVVTTAKSKFDYHKLDYGLDKEQVTKVEDSYGNITQYFYNQFGQVENVLSPLGNESKTIFDIAGRVVQKTDQKGAVVQYDYDELGNRNSFLSADGAIVQYSFNDQHLPVSFTDALGSKWVRQYDQGGRVTQVTNPLASNEHFRYNPSGSLVEHQNATGDIRYFSWDKFSNLIAATDWQGNRTNYNWDAYGKIAEVVDPAGHRISVRTDKIGRIDTLTYPDGSQKKYRWSVFDSLSEFTDELGNTTTYQYCDCGNLELERQPDGSTIHYGWDALPGQLIALTNQNAEVFHFEYDADGRMVQETDFSGSITKFEYNEVGKVSRVVRPSGKTIDYSYNAVGKVVNVKYDDETDSRFSFDLNGRLVSADNSQCPVEFEYDQVGRLIHESQGEHELWHEYDELNRRISRKSGTDDATYFEWNVNSQIEKILTDGFEDIGFSYDSRRIEQNRQFGSNLNFSSSADERGRLVSQKLDTGKISTSLRRDYVYDVSGNLLQKQDSKWGTTQYAYDELERITKTLHPDGEKEYFQYDRADNVIAYARGKFTSETTNDTSTLNTKTWSYARGSRVVNIGDVEFHYDDDGQLAKRMDSSGETTYLWNSAGQLIGLDKGEGEVWHYSYDALSRRVLKEGPNESHEYVWDGDVILKEYKLSENDDTTLDQWEYNPHDFSPLFKVQSKEQYFALNDQIGSPLELVDKRGEIVWSMRTYTFGESKRLTEGQVNCNVRFQGQWFDEESGFSYNRFRYYSAELCAFVSDDPIGLLGGINLRNLDSNSVNFSDVYGLTTSCVLGDLTEAEISQIQSVVDEAGRPLEVVGSAARGQRRGVGSDLPIGKGPGTRSDTDFTTAGSSIDNFRGLESNLPNADPQTPILRGVGDPFQGPVIRFEPGAAPALIPSG